MGKEECLGQVRQAHLYQCIKECHEEYGDPVELCCEILHVSRTAYYAWLAGNPCERRRE